MREFDGFFSARGEMFAWRAEPCAQVDAANERRGGSAHQRGGGPPRRTHSTPSDGDEVAAAVDQHSDNNVCPADPEAFFSSGGTGDGHSLSCFIVHRWKLLLFHLPLLVRTHRFASRCFSTTCISTWSSKPGPPPWKMRTLNQRPKFWTTSAWTKTLGWLWSKSKSILRNMDQTVSTLGALIPSGASYAAWMDRLIRQEILLLPLNVRLLHKVSVKTNHPPSGALLLAHSLMHMRVLKAFIAYQTLKVGTPEQKRTKSFI